MSGMKKNSYLIAGFLLLLFPALCHAQTAPGKKQGNKHRFYFYWGWNRGYFTQSDIHFTGRNYDFTLENVVAKDRQSEFSFEKYFHPKNITIPQTNYGVGYYFNDHYIISLGMDHMKYVVQQDQEVSIFGRIENSGTEYDGTYDGDPILLRKNFLELEHTDGLNYLVAEVSRSDNLLQSFPALQNKLELNLIEGVGAGVLIPRTDAKLLGFERNNRYHLAGFGFSAKAGLHLTIFRHFFIRGELKAGFINLTSIRTTPDETDKATQHFFFLQPTGQFGGMFYLKKQD